jgi:hypothetical protein
MRSLEINGNLDSKRKLVMTLYWINRKTATIEGCAPFIIQRIKTERTTHVAEDGKFLKFSEGVLGDVLTDMDELKMVEFDINFGNEDIKASIHEDILSVSLSRTKELEDEIVEKLKYESERKYPHICSKFYRRLGIFN